VKLSEIGKKLFGKDKEVLVCPVILILIPTSFNLHKWLPCLIHVSIFFGRSYTDLPSIISLQNIQQFHRDHVPTVPTSPFHFECIGSTDLCANQGMVLFYDHLLKSSTSNGANTDDHRSLIRKIHIFTIQGHPEFHASIMSKLVENRAARGILSQEVAVDARARNALEATAVGQERIGNVVTGNEWANDGLEVGKVIWEMLGL
jgi:hypothetical protein